jgi:hypothetical protein
VDNNLEKDVMFEKREKQLKAISSEIKRFEQIIKVNINIVDNMIIPQLKAMTITFNEHKDKYKKLKKASYAFNDRVKKGDKELQELLEKKNKVDE